MCGGTDAPCANGLAEAPIPLPDQQCVSQSCDTASKKCAAMPTAGVPNGYPCSNSDICASGESASDPSFFKFELTTGNRVSLLSGWSSPEKLVCSLAASQGARTRKRSTEVCPASQIACKVSVSAGFECIDPQTNLEQCGGCLADGTGIDCTAIPGAESVACEAGRCIVSK